MLFPKRFPNLFSVPLGEKRSELSAVGCPFWWFWSKYRWVSLVYLVVYHLPGNPSICPKTPMVQRLGAVWAALGPSKRMGGRVGWCLGGCWPHSELSFCQTFFAEEGDVFQLVIGAL